jgi:hypothetical protein
MQGKEKEVAKHGKGMLILENYKSMNMVVAAVVGEPMKKHLLTYSMEQSPS